jgi:zinc transport system ATP-binding protein
VSAIPAPPIALHDVAVRFGDVPVLEGIDLSVGPGEFLGIIGPNGAGKSTLLRVMLGLLSPTAGEARLFGEPARRFGAWRRLGYVPQRAALHAGVPLTVREVVATGLHALLASGGGRSGRRAARARVADTLEQVGMSPHAGSRFHRLSVGQQQRVLIARALVSEPELLLLDEPTSGVDPEAQATFYALLRQLQRLRQLTLVLVSHDVGVVTTQVTQLACLNRRLVFHGPPEAFLQDAMLRTLYGADVRVVRHDHE